MELDERDVGRFSNQTQDARWHDHKIVIYTDAACAENGKDDCKAAYAIYLNNKSNYNRQACIKNPKDYLTTGILTNNRAEIIARIEALKLAKQYNFSKIEIRTDSKWVVDYFRLFRKLRLQEVQNGKNPEWRMDRKILYLLKRYASTVEEVTFVHIPGQSYDLSNLEVDKMAKQELE